MLPSPATLAFSRIQDCINQDTALSQSIESIEIKSVNPAGCQVLIMSTVDGIDQVHDKLFWIVRVVNSLMPVSEVWFNGDRISMRTIVAMNPKVKLSAGKQDRKLVMQQKRQRRRLLQTTFEALANDYSVFLLSPEGRYEEVRFHTGTKSLIPAEQMIGRFLHEVIGEDASETIIDCLKKAQRIDRAQECYYDITFENGERRWYLGRAYPSPDGDPQLFTVKRVK